MAPPNLPLKNQELARKIVHRPWGNITVIGSWPSKITVRVLTINPRSRISLQTHRLRDEEWLCVRGSAIAQVDDRTYRLKAGEKIFVPRTHLHRVGSVGGAEILEVAYGTFKDEDIVRLEDDYGRGKER
jgi:mannose-6-phosphate isomerase-like protein (cupin superfamily)